jgi:tetratricopeptide (TPR) repeat protein
MRPVLSADRSPIFGLGTPILALLLLVAASVAPGAAQIDPQTALLEKTGWEALAGGHARAAAEAFRTAIVADSKNPRLYLGAATAAYLEQRNEDSRLALEHALALDPKLSDALVLLGQVLYRAGDLPGAIRTYERLVADLPDDQRSRVAIERWRREAELNDRMRHSLNERFTASFEGPEEAPLAVLVLESLDRAYWRIGEALSTFPNQAISVVLYTTEQFRDITRAPTWAAAAYDGTIPVPVRGAVENPKELDRVLAHEFTHAVVRALAPRNVPTWLNEGLATALETGDTAWAQERVTRAGGPMSLETLRTSFGRLTGDQAQLAYATSALAVRQLLDEAGGFAMTNLLRDLGEGVDFDVAFAHRIQRSFAEWTAGR